MEARVPSSEARGPRPGSAGRGARGPGWALGRLPRTVVVLSRRGVGDESAIGNRQSTIRPAAAGGAPGGAGGDGFDFGVQGGGFVFEAAAGGGGGRGGDDAVGGAVRDGADVPIAERAGGSDGYVRGGRGGGARGGGAAGGRVRDCAGDGGLHREPGARAGAGHGFADGAGDDGAYPRGAGDGQPDVVAPGDGRERGHAARARGDVRGADGGPVGERPHGRRAVGGAAPDRRG